MAVRRTLTLLLASLALVVAGCGQDEPEPKLADPTPTPVASPTAEEVAAEETPEEFIQRWADTSRDMQNTGETVAYKSITRACESCRELVKTVENYYAAGGYVQFKGMKVLGIQKENGLTFIVRVFNGPTEYKRSKTATVERFEDRAPRGGGL